MNILSKYKGILNYTKLIKLLYLSDRKSFELTGYSISGDAYVSMKNGPVLSLLYDLIRNNCNETSLQYYWNSKFTTDGYDIHQVCDYIPLGELSKNDIEIMDLIDKQFHYNDFRQMIDFVHKNCPEWQMTFSSIPLSKIKIMKNVGISDDDIKLILSEESSYETEKELLKSLDYPIEDYV